MKILWKIAKQKIRCYRLPYKVQNTLWEFHKGDCDDFPSVLHGHAMDKRNRKLSLWDGGIYEGTDRTPIAYVSTKEMRKLSADKCFSKFVREARQAYREITHREPPALKWCTVINKTTHRQDVYSIGRIFISKDQKTYFVCTSSIVRKKRR